MRACAPSLWAVSTTLFNSRSEDGLIASARVKTSTWALTAEARCALTTPPARRMRAQLQKNKTKRGQKWPLWTDTERMEHLLGCAEPVAVCFATSKYRSYARPRQEGKQSFYKSSIASSLTLAQSAELACHRRGLWIPCRPAA